MLTIDKNSELLLEYETLVLEDLDTERYLTDILKVLQDRKNGIPTLFSKIRFLRDVKDIQHDYENSSRSRIGLDHIRTEFKMDDGADFISWIKNLGATIRNMQERPVSETPPQEEQQ